MIELSEQPKSSIEVRFDERRKLAVITGPTEKVLNVFYELFILKYPDRVGQAEHEVNNIRSSIDKGIQDYEYTFGVTERVRIRRDIFGDFGKPGSTLMLYLPNSPHDEREETETIARIKANMLKIGHKI